MKIFFILCALAQPPWSFIDPFHVEAKIATIADLHKFDNLYPAYEFRMALKNVREYPEPGWNATPWVFKKWRIWARLKQSA